MAQPGGGGDEGRETGVKAVMVPTAVKVCRAHPTQ